MKSARENTLSGNVQHVCQLVPARSPWYTNYMGNHFNVSLGNQYRRTRVTLFYKLSLER